MVVFGVADVKDDIDDDDDDVGARKYLLLYVHTHSLSHKIT